MFRPAAVKDRGLLAAEATALLCPAVIFTVSGDALHILVLTVIGLAVSFVARRPLPRNTRSVVYAGVIALVTATLANEILPVDPERFIFMPAHVYCPIFLFVAVAVTYFEQREDTLTAVTLLSVLTTMMAGDTFWSAVRTPPAIPGGHWLVAHFYWFYGVMVAVQLGACVLVLRRMARGVGAVGEGRRHRLRYAVVVVTVALVSVGAAIGLRTGMVMSEDQLRRVFFFMMRGYMHRARQGVVFGDDVNLWQTVPYHQEDDQTVVLRALADTAPGYLRGRVLRTYHDGTWRDMGSASPLSARTAGGRRAYTVFEVRGRLEPITDTAPPPTRAARILPAALMESSVLFAPGTTHEIEAVANELRLNPDGVLRPEAWDLKAGYVLHIKPGGPAYPRPGRETVQFIPVGPSPREIREGYRLYLEVPPYLRPRLARIVRDATADLGDNAPASAVVAAVTQFLNRDFEYELGVPMHTRTDPVLQFLDEKRRGHCELFASAAALLLRVHGIPTRYVTGFVCAEPAAGGRYWLSRLSDCHAWVEAYLPEEDRWVMVEATPPGGIPDATTRGNPFAAVWDGMVAFWQSAMAKLKRGEVAEFIVASVLATVEFVVWSFSHPLRAVVSLGFLLVLGRVLWVRYRRRKGAEQVALPVGRRLLQRYVRTLTRLAARKGVRVTPGTTVRELATRLVDLLPHQEQRERFLALVSEFEVLRYGPQEAGPEAVRRFTDTAVREIRSLDWP